jgi:phage terminase small subunit
MAPLRNARHEAFVRGLFEGKTALDSYEAAGFARDDGNAARLRRNPKVEERLAELQAEIAGETKVTVASLLGELEEARLKATDVKQLSAAIRAVEGKAKLSGLMVERQRIEVSGVGNFDSCQSAEDIAAEMAEGVMLGLDSTHSATEEDRARLVELFLEALEAFGKVCHEIGERISAEVRSRPLGSVPYLSPMALPSVLNGKATVS